MCRFIRVLPSSPLQPRPETCECYRGPLRAGSRPSGTRGFAPTLLTLKHTLQMVSSLATAHRPDPVSVVYDHPITTFSGVLRPGLQITGSYMAFGFTFNRRRSASCSAFAWREIVLPLTVRSLQNLQANPSNSCRFGSSGALSSRGGASAGPRRGVSGASRRVLSFRRSSKDFPCLIRRCSLTRSGAEGRAEQHSLPHMRTYASSSTISWRRSNRL